MVGSPTSLTRSKSASPAGVAGQTTGRGRQGTRPGTPPPVRSRPSSAGSVGSADPMDGKEADAGFEAIAGSEGLSPPPSPQGRQGQQADNNDGENRPGLQHGAGHNPAPPSDDDLEGPQGSLDEGTSSRDRRDLEDLARLLLARASSA